MQILSGVWMMRMGVGMPCGGFKSQPLSWCWDGKRSRACEDCRDLCLRSCYYGDVLVQCGGLIFQRGQFDVWQLVLWIHVVVLGKAAFTVALHVKVVILCEQVHDPYPQESNGMLN